MPENVRFIKGISMTHQNGRTSIPCHHSFSRWVRRGSRDKPPAQGQPIGCWEGNRLVIKTVAFGVIIRLKPRRMHAQQKIEEWQENNKPKEPIQDIPPHRICLHRKRSLLNEPYRQAIASFTKCEGMAMYFFPLDSSYSKYFLKGAAHIKNRHLRLPPEP